MHGYCLKCKKTRKMDNPKPFAMKNKRKAAKGVCSKCGTKMFRILKKGEKIDG